MKTITMNPKKSSILLAISFGLLVVLGYAQTARCQQWNTDPNNTNNIYYNAGNVGIGTTSPQALLNIHSAAADGTSVQLAITGGVSGSRDLDFRGVHVSNDGSNKILGRIRLTNDGSFTQSGELGFFTGRNDGSNNITLSEWMRIKSNGNVGIGTTSPSYKFEVKDGTDAKIRITGTGSSDAELSIGTASNGRGIYLDESDANKLKIYTGSGKGGAGEVTFDNSGNVGIGTTSPASKLQIVGGDLGIDGNQNLWLSASKDTGINENPSTGVINFVVPGNGSTRGFNFLYGSTSKMSIDGATGNVTIAGTVNAKYQDVAEWVPSSEQFSAGTVVVLDSTKANQVTSSSVSYDTRVAGVVSEQPGIALGEKSDGKVLVATTGRVRVKVDATKTPIHIGDLLVTSDVPGMAMKSEPVEFAGRKMHMPGTLIGKAQEPLEKGKGEIVVLLSLQ